MTKVDQLTIRRCRARVAKSAALAFVVMLAAAIVPAVASAQAPRITKNPELAGPAQEGQTLREVAAEWERGSPNWSWWRCDGPEPNENDCDPIPGMTDRSYAVTEGDIGHVIRVVLFVSNRDGWTYRVSRQTATVTAAPKPAPTPPPEPTPPPAPDGTGGVLGQEGPNLMDPVPVVRIRGRMTSNGVRITLLTVRAPKGARVTVVCRGRSCPAKRWATTAALKRIVKFQRRLRAGTRLTISVTKADRIGKHTTFLIRRGKAPKRVDRCVYPGARKPVRCPSG